MLLSVPAGSWIVAILDIADKKAAHCSAPFKYWHANPLSSSEYCATRSCQRTVEMITVYKKILKSIFKKIQPPTPVL